MPNNIFSRNDEFNRQSYGTTQSVDLQVQKEQPAKPAEQDGFWSAAWKRGKAQLEQGIATTVEELPQQLTAFGAQLAAGGLGMVGAIPLGTAANLAKASGQVAAQRTDEAVGKQWAGASVPVTSAFRRAAEQNMREAGPSQMSSDAYMNTPTSLSEVPGYLGRVGKFAAEKTVESAPALGAGFAAGLINPSLGRAVAGGLTYAQEYGGIRQAQAEQGITDYSGATTSAVGATALDLLAGATPAVTNVRNMSAAQAARGLAKEAWHVGKEEGVTETVQTAIERLGAGQDLLSKDALADYIGSFIAGFGGGTVFGGGAGMVRHKLGSKSQQEEDKDTSDRYEQSAATTAQGSDVAGGVAADDTLTSGTKAATPKEPDVLPTDVVKGLFNKGNVESALAGTGIAPKYLPILSKQLTDAFQAGDETKLDNILRAQESRASADHASVKSDEDLARNEAIHGAVSQLIGNFREFHTQALQEEDLLTGAPEMHRIVAEKNRETTQRMQELKLRNEEAASQQAELQQQAIAQQQEQQAAQAQAHEQELAAAAKRVENIHRQGILQTVVSDPETRDPAKRFMSLLKRNNFDPNISEEEGKALTEATAKIEQKTAADAAKSGLSVQEYKDSLPARAAKEADALGMAPDQYVAAKTEADQMGISVPAWMQMQQERQQAQPQQAAPAKAPAPYFELEAQRELNDADRAAMEKAQAKRQRKSERDMANVAQEAANDRAQMSFLSEPGSKSETGIKQRYDVGKKAAEAFAAKEAAVRAAAAAAEKAPKKKTPAKRPALPKDQKTEAAKPEPKEKKRAPEKRKKPKGRVTERVRADKERQAAEAGRGNRPEPSRAIKEKAQEEVAPKPLGYGDVFKNMQAAEKSGDLTKEQAARVANMIKLQTKPAAEIQSSMEKAVEANVKQSEAAVAENSETKYRRPEGEQGKGVTKSALEAVVEKITSSWGLDQPVQVIDSLDQLPESVRDAVKKDKAEDALGFVAKDGTVYLLSHNIPNVEVGTAALYHETLGHKGLAKLLRTRLDQVLRTMLATNKTLRDAAKEWARLNPEAYTGKDRFVRSAEEVLAKMSEKGALDVGLLHKVGAVIKELGRRAGLKLAYSDAEVRAILSMAHDQIINGPRESTVMRGLRYMTAWHGSPHDFEKFSTDFMGTGEGAQAYGWGLYFASARGVAEHYKKILTGHTFTVDGTPFEEWANKNLPKGKYNQNAIKAVTRQLRWLDSMSSKDIKAFADYYREDIAHAENSLKSGFNEDPRFERYPISATERVDMEKDLARNKAQLAVLDKLSEHTLSPEGAGKLYQVEIGPKEEEFLDWDKPLFEQSKYVQDALREMGINPEETQGSRYPDSGADLYMRLQRSLKGKRNASQALLDGGIQGNRYLDASSRGAKEGGTHNYVVFNDENVQIVNKYMRAEKTSVASKNMPEEFSEPANNVGSKFLRTADEALSVYGFTENLIEDAQKLIPSTKKYLTAMRDRMVKKEEMVRHIEGIRTKFVGLGLKRQGVGNGTLNGYLQDTVQAEKWGFQPDWLENDVEVDPELEAKFKALPASEQAIVKEALKTSHDTLKQKIDAVIDAVTNTYEGLMLKAMDEGNETKLAKLELEQKNALAEYRGLFAARKDIPYVTTRRFGDYMVVAKSSDLHAAQELGDAKLIEEMKGQEDHYFVQRYDTKQEARAARDKIKASGAFDGGTVISGEVDKTYQQFVGNRDMMLAYDRLRKLIQDQTEAIDPSNKVNAKVISNMERLAVDLQLLALRQTSARKSELRKIGVAGGDMDMMRNFVAQGAADAHMISSLMHSKKVDETVESMRKEAFSDFNADPEKARRFYNELMLRHAAGMAYERSEMAEVIKSTTSMFMLSLSPSYYLTNLTQPWVLSVPYMAGEHSYAKVNAEMIRSYGDVAKAWKDTGVTDALNLDNVAADVRDVIQELANRGRIDIGVDKEIGEFHSLKEGKISNAFDKGGTVIRAASQKVESVNRVSTAATAYRLAKDAGKTHEQAVDYADKVIRLTHGTYDGFNAPRWMRGPVLSTVTQFKKFQLMQATLLWQLTKNSLSEANTKEAKIERAVARRQLWFTMWHTMGLAGLKGMPAMTAVVFLANLIKGAMDDDDEPADIEQDIRDAIGKDYADLLMTGVPSLAGIDISDRVGMGQVASIIPYSDVKFSREGFFTALAGLLGPGAALVGKAGDAANALYKYGDYYGAVGKLLPNGLDDAYMAYREATKGVKSGGDTVIDPADIDWGQTFARGMGVMTVERAERLRTQSHRYDMIGAFKDRSHEITRDYAEAMDAGDAEAKAKARADWKKLQDERKAAGEKVQPLSNLMRAYKTRNTKRKATVKGVQYTPKSEALRQAQEDAASEE